MSFARNLIHTIMSIRAIARAPITTPDVGVNKFHTPEAAWNAVITRWDLT